MADGPNGFVVIHPGGQPPKHELQPRALFPHAGVRELVEEPAHGAVPLGGAMAARLATALMASGTDADLRGQLASGGEGGSLRADFRKDLLGGVDA
jgi:hypothetical protein